MLKNILKIAALFVTITTSGKTYGQCQWKLVGDTIFGSANNQNLGINTSLSGDGKVVAFASDKSDTSKGIVKVYYQDSSGWKQKGNTLYGQKNYEYFGSSISLSHSGDTMAIGAEHNSTLYSGNGKIEVYYDSAGKWVLIGNPIYGKSFGYNFGFSVDITPDGNTIVGGSIRERHPRTRYYVGQVRVYTLDTIWKQVGGDIDGDSNITLSEFGHSVAISDDSKTLMIGSRRQDISTSYGAMFVYQFDSSGWKRKQKLDLARTSLKDSYYGTDVDISSSGDYAVMSGKLGVVAFKKDTKGIYQQHGSILGDTTGDTRYTSIAMSGDGLTIAANIYVKPTGWTKYTRALQTFEFDRNDWAMKGSPFTFPANNSSYGYSVDMSTDGKRIAVGLPLAPVITREGTLFVLEYDNIANSTPDTIRVTTCKPFKTRSGKTLLKSGVYIDTLDKGFDCDSLFRIEYQRTLDTTKPLIKAKNISAYINSSGKVEVFTADVLDSAWDNCEIAKIELAKSVFKCDELGINKTYLRASDIIGNVDSALVTITIKDTSAPVTKFSSTIIYLNSSGRASISDSLAAINSFDNCGISKISLSKKTFSCDELGKHIVMMTLIDKQGKSDSTEIEVIVGDTLQKIDTTIINSCLTYISPTSKYITKQGHYYDTLLNTSGCDSVFNLDVQLQNELKETQDTVRRNSNSFGYDLDFSESGRLVAISSYRENLSAGVTRIYQYDTQWSQLGSEITGEKRSDYSGWALAVSDFGKTVAIGAKYNDDGGNFAGHVRVYNYQGKTQWVQLGQDIDGKNIDELSGWSVDVSSTGLTVAVGAPFAFTRRGVVRVYDYSFIKNLWTMRGNEIQGDTSYDLCGSVVKLSADGKRVAVSSPDYNSYVDRRGQTKVFEWTGSKWSQIGGNIEGDSGQHLGSSMAFSQDGKTIAVGSGETADGGIVKTYTLKSGKWVLKGQVLRRPSPSRFGTSIDLAKNGETLIVGDPAFDTEKGQITQFAYNDSVWLITGSQITGTYPRIDLANKVSISENGRTYGSGAPSASIYGNLALINRSEIKINQEPDTIRVSLCNGEFKTPRGKTFRSLGTHNDTFQTTLGCDSLITYIIDSNSQHEAYLRKETCDSFISPLGNKFVNSKQIVERLPLTGKPCDSIITIDLKVFYSNHDSLTIKSCGPYMSESGKTYSKSGDYIEMYTNQYGCDSSISMDLTINPTSSDTLTVHTCSYYITPSGRLLIKSGLYLDSLITKAGCDSTYLINLTVGRPSLDTLILTTCNSFTSPSGKYITETSVFLDTIVNNSGCDSVTLFAVTVNHPSQDSFKIETCDEFVSPSGKRWTTSGNFADTLTNHGGCDSIVNFDLKIQNLEIKTNPNDTFTQTGTNVFFAIKAIANDSIKYQWQHSRGGSFQDITNQNQFLGVNTDTLWVSETTNKNHGESFRCLVSTDNCSLASESANIVVVLGLKELRFGIKYYPNPTTSKLNIDIPSQMVGLDYTIYDLQGRLVMKGNLLKSNNIIDTNKIISGSYILKINKGKIYLPFIKISE